MKRHKIQSEMRCFSRKNKERAASSVGKGNYCWKTGRRCRPRSVHAHAARPPRHPLPFSSFSRSTNGTDGECAGCLPALTVMTAIRLIVKDPSNIREEETHNLNLKESYLYQTRRININYIYFWYNFYSLSKLGHATMTSNKM